MTSWAHGWTRPPHPHEFCGCHLASLRECHRTWFRIGEPYHPCCQCATEPSEYKEWWYGERKSFLLSIRDHLQSHVADDAVVLFTADHSESGRSIGPFVADDVESVTDQLSAVGSTGWTVLDFATTVDDDVYRTSRCRKYSPGEAGNGTTVSHPRPF